MLKLQGFVPNLSVRGLRAWVPLCALSALFLLPAASAQVDFTLSAPTLSPDAVAPGGVASANVAVVAGTGFVGPVALTCTVVPTVQITSTNFPTCAVSPASLTSSGGASATVTTYSKTPQVSYTITITGTDASGTQTASLDLTVLSVTPQFTINVTGAMSPTSVVAGNGAEGIITVNPLDGYSTPPGGYITLYCASISPLVTIAPVCSFSTNVTSTNKTGLQVSGNSPVSSTLTISTFGPIIVGQVAHPRSLAALWLFLPVLGFAGLGTALGGKRSSKLWGVLALLVVGAGLLLLPACSNTNSTSTSTPNGVTPANTYTFTIIGVDTNGVVSSNTTSGTTVGTSVTLTVTAPPK